MNYSIQVITGQYRTVQVGEYVVDYIIAQNSQSYYEIDVKNTGHISLKYSKCLGEINFLYKTLNDKKWIKILRENKDPQNDDTEFDIFVEKPGLIYLKVEKETEKTENFNKKDPMYNTLKDEYYVNTINSEFDIDEYNKMASIYSFQVNYKKNSEVKNLEDYMILGSNGDIDLQLGAYPMINIDPISIDNKIANLYDFKISYHLVLSNN